MLPQFRRIGREMGLRLDFGPIWRFRDSYLNADRPKSETSTSLPMCPLRNPSVKSLFNFNEALSITSEMGPRKNTRWGRYATPHGPFRGSTLERPPRRSHLDNIPTQSWRRLECSSLTAIKWRARRLVARRTTHF